MHINLGHIIFEVSNIFFFATDKSKIHRERVSFEKQGGDWKIIQKEDARGSENTRKF